MVQFISCRPSLRNRAVILPRVSCHARRLVGSLLALVVKRVLKRSPVRKNGQVNIFGYWRICRSISLKCEKPAPASGFGTGKKFLNLRRKALDDRFANTR